ncbi:uncharacterized protein J3D65DRAFT_632158 [Phyllosticta citribraziliensis]|uniref:Secreted protein n=1 Tax=Phyllosticta citribraziliensis TaxID=989973 RepID=A0ABR1LFN5_9PEZI
MSWLHWLSRACWMPFLTHIAQSTVVIDTLRSHWHSRARECHGPSSMQVSCGSRIAMPFLPEACAGPRPLATGRK